MAAATLMHDNGADTRFIQQLLDHAELTTTQICTQVAIRKLKEFPHRYPSGPVGAKWKGRAMSEGLLVGVFAVTNCDH